MIFLPYRMDSEKNGLPIFTIIICIICVFIYWEQYSKDVLHYSAIEQFCYEDLDRRDISFLRNIAHEESGNHCSLIFSSIREATNSKEKISELAKQAKPIGIFASNVEDFKYISSHLEELFKQYDYKVPQNLTNELAYNPKDLDVLKMATSTFSHGDIFHLFGNLLFFYIFAASVELIVGSFVYSVFITVVTISTSLAYSYAMIGVEEALPTIGLSGVVMAAVAALGVMVPSAKIRCFFWFFIYFKVFRISAFFLAFWYIGWDVYEMNKFGNDSYINYVAHVSGAGVGVLLGIFYVLFRKDILRNSAVNY
jgi:membrane associated rhomboid family serine protease